MKQLSSAGFALYAKMFNSVPSHNPTLLYEAFTDGIDRDDLCRLLMDAWVYSDWPEDVLDSHGWLAMFRSAGFFSLPHEFAPPTKELTLFRAATKERSRRMSWTDNENLAKELGKRHSNYGDVVLFQTIVKPELILAYLGRNDEGWTVVVDPTGLVIEEVA
jgi:hypothetical protein